jgi:hypothetical protein
VHNPATPANGTGTSIYLVGGKVSREPSPSSLGGRRLAISRSITRSLASPAFPGAP